jgi:cysteine-rich repeat protein
VDAGEECDQGTKNGHPGSTCTDRCQRSTGFCGDGILESALNEQCDLGKNLNGKRGQDCDGHCHFVKLPTCGDGIIDPAYEQCDAGILNSDLPGAPCRSNCMLPRCGDGILDPNEECDDGNNFLGDGCSDVCIVENPAAPSLPADLTSADAFLISSRNPSLLGQPVTFTYTIRRCTSDLRALTADVQFTDERTSPPTVLGSAPLQDCFASLTTSSLTPGLHSILGTSPGDANHGRILSNIVLQRITIGGVPSPARASTGPELIIFLASGAAVGVGLMRRRWLKRGR